MADKFQTLKSPPEQLEQLETRSLCYEKLWLSQCLMDPLGRAFSTRLEQAPSWGFRAFTRVEEET